MPPPSGSPATQTLGNAESPRSPGGRLRLLAAVASSALICLCSPAYPLWWLSFIAWIPLIWACERVSARRAFGYGWLTGTLTILFGFAWVTDLLQTFGGLPTPFALLGHGLFAGYHGLMWALPMGCAAAIGQRRPAALVWALPLAWGAAEVLLPQVFEVHMSYFWSTKPEWIQTADVVGSTGVGMLMLLLNVLIYRAAQSIVTEPSRAWKPIAVPVLIGVAIPSYGALRMRQVETAMENRPHVDIGVVQGNFGIKTRRAHRAQALSSLQRMSAELEAQGAQMLVWGETSYPYSRFRRDTKRDFPHKRRYRVRRGFEAPLILGVVTRKRKGRPFDVWNTALVLESDGTVGDLYDKNYPLWFGEHAPFVDPAWYLATFPNASHITRGEEPGALRVGDYTFGPLICYEDLLPTFTRETAALGVNALLAMNNESWFGRTNAQIDHLGLSTLRAVEHRLPLVRAVNAGPSAYITPAGVTKHRTPVTDSDRDGLQPPDGFVASVPMMDGTKRTLYGRFGGQFRFLVCVALAVALGLTLGSKRRQLGRYAPRH
ncbi:MAG: apolipoprotein N-acyltransferase [Myxococcales bacterium FL481]|nr:MAG: apolipoprotein N-acyltransferase [Myxococcales bacterium FL481]